MNDVIAARVSGARLRRLRVAQGLSQATVAEATGIATGSISALESADGTVGPATLRRLADLLGCEPDYLQSTQPELTATAPRLRAYADAPEKVVERAIADATTAVQAARNMRFRFVRDSLPLFNDDLADDFAIEAWAGEVRAAADLDTGGPINNVIRAAERMGCIVLPMDSELGRHLGLSLRVDDLPIIRVSRSARQPEHAIPGDRQRFTVAHELGHLVLHHSNRRPSSPEEAKRLEKQAHRFAAAFLVPGDSLMHDLNGLGERVTLRTLTALKEKWGYAVKAFVVRFQQLGVIGDDQARSLHKQISARGWNKHEPVFVGTESAVWYAKAVARAAGKEDQQSFVRHVARLENPWIKRWTDWSPVDWTASIEPKEHEAEPALADLLTFPPQRSSAW